MKKNKIFDNDSFAINNNLPIKHRGKNLISRVFQHSTSLIVPFLQNDLKTHVKIKHVIIFTNEACV